MSPVLIDVPQMIDLALGSPDFGVIKFNILHALLHVIVHQTNLKTCSVEFRGDQSMTVEQLIACVPTESIINLSEFEVQQVEEDGKNVTKRVPVEKPKLPEKIVVVRKVGDVTDNASTVVLTRTQEPAPKSTPSTPKPLSQDEIRSLSAPPRDIFKIPEDACSDSSMSEIPERTCPTHGIWNIANLTKRVENAECQLNKLTHSSKTSPRSKNIDEKDQNSQKGAEIPISELSDQVACLEKVLYNHLALEKNLRERLKTYGALFSETQPQSLKTVHYSDDDIKQLREDMEAMKLAVKQVANAQVIPLSILSADKLEEIDDMQCELEEENESPKRKYINERLSILEKMLGTIERKICYVEKEITTVAESSKNNNNDGCDNKEVGCLSDLYAELTDFRTELGETKEKCDYLNTERKKIVKNLCSLIKKVEELKETKMDKEEACARLAEKASIEELNEKASKDDFEALKNELMEGLREVLEQLAVQKSCFTKAIIEIQGVLEEKLSKEEFEEAKKDIEEQLEKIKKTLEILCAAKQDQEAAGTRIRYLNDVNCIACNKNAMMRMDEESRIKKEGPAPPQNLFSPYRIYALHKMRNKCRGLLAPTPVRKSAETKCSRAINRYCGGSHTILTPQAKVQQRSAAQKMYTNECGDRTTTKICICPTKKE